jgi:uncharacterized damage-inducible protein DinB
MLDARTRELLESVNLTEERTMMMKRLCLLVVSGCSLAAIANAQPANPLSTETKQAYTAIKNNLTRMADKMPEDQYGFRPAPEVRTFGELVGHVADAQAGICSMVSGEKKAVNAGAKTTKADLVAALKESFVVCDAVYDAMTDARGVETVKMGPNDRTKLGVLAYNTTHSNEEYGYMAVYLRLKGIVPPSSEKR